MSGISLDVSSMEEDSIFVDGTPVTADVDQVENPFTDLSAQDDNQLSQADLVVFDSLNGEQTTNAEPGTNNSVKLLVHHGQSLAIGFNSPPEQTEAGFPLLSAQTQFPDKVLTLDDPTNLSLNIGFKGELYEQGSATGFQPLRQTVFETHASGMSEALVSRYEAAGLEAPSLVNIMGGRGGRSIQELMIREKDIFSSLEDGLAAVEIGDLFAVEETDGTFSMYINADGDVGVDVGSTDDRPVYLENLINQSIDAVAIAQDMGRDVDTELVFTWIHGQANNPIIGQFGSVTYSYNDLLKQLVTRFETDLEQATGIDFSVEVLVNQLRGFGKRDLPVHQLELVTESESDNYHLGAVEHAYQNVYSEDQDTGTNAHLTRMGYRLMGEQMGHIAADIILGDGGDKPLLIDQVYVVGEHLFVKFSGIDGVLVDDQSVADQLNFTSNPIENLGFGVFNRDGNNLAGPEGDIVQAQIIDNAFVHLQLGDVITEEFRLDLGRESGPRFDLEDPAIIAFVEAENPGASEEEIAAEIEATFGRANTYGTTLRSSNSIDPITPFADIPDSNRSDNYELDGLEIYEFSPTQHIDIDPTMDGILSSLVGVHVDDFWTDFSRRPNVNTFDGIDVVIGDDDDNGIFQAEIVFAGAGNDTIRGNKSTGEVLLNGGLGDDLISGGNLDDVLDGGSGSDDLRGRDGDDLLIIDTDDSRINGGDGFDTVYLESDGDLLFGDPLIFNVEQFDMDNGFENTVSMSWRAAFRSGNDRLIVLGEEGDVVELDTSFGGVGEDFTVSQTQLNGVDFNVYSASRFSWLDVEIYVDADVSVVTF